MVCKVTYQVFWTILVTPKAKVPMRNSRTMIESSELELLSVVWLFPIRHSNSSACNNPSGFLYHFIALYSKFQFGTFDWGATKWRYVIVVYGIRSHHDRKFWIGTFNISSPPMRIGELLMEKERDLPTFNIEGAISIHTPYGGLEQNENNSSGTTRGTRTAK